MTWVLDSAPVEDSTQTLVLLCLADWANDAGLCWPSIDSIARRARCSESTARRTIRALEKAGLVIREASTGRSTNRYRIITNPNPVTVTGSAVPSPSYPQASNPVRMTPGQIDGVADSTLAPVTANPGVGDTPTLAPVTPEPSLNPHDPPAAGGGLARLEAAARAAGLSARFDRLSALEHQTVEMLIGAHGIPALIATARAQHRAEDPARYASAWLQSWLAMPLPQAAPASRPTCGECVEGWIEDPVDGRPIRRCACRAVNA